MRDFLDKIADTISKSKNRKELLRGFSKFFSELAPGSVFLIFLIHEETGELNLIYPKGFSPEFSWIRESVFSKELLKHKRIKIRDNYFTLFSLPIRVHSEEIGKVVFVDKKPRSYFSKKQKLLETLVKYLGLGIKSIDVEKSLRKKEEKIELLSEVSSTITSKRYLKEILDLIVVLTSQVLNSKICSITLLDEAKQELFIVATQSLSPLYRNKPNLKVGQSISGRVIKEKRPITVLDVTEEAGYMYPQIAKKEGIVSMLSVPMMVKERPIGVINLYTAYKHSFTQEEIATLSAVANQAAVAIENTNLATELLASKEALEARKMIERAKGVLMKRLKIGEEEAYRILQKKSMDLRKGMKEVAEAIILAEQVSSI